MALKRRRKARKSAAKSRLIAETNASRLITGFFRVLRVRREEVQRKQQEEADAKATRVHKVVVIQCAARKYIARGFVRRMRRYQQSCVLASKVIQRATRCFLSRITTKRMRVAKARSTAAMLLAERQRRAATKIQSVYRRRHTSIRLLIQRGDMKSAREKGWHLGRSAAATRIQKVFRGHVVRKLVRVELRNRNIRRRNREHAARRLNATVLLQSAIRGQTARLGLRPAYFTFVKQRRALRAVGRVRAAVIMQCFARKMAAIQVLRNKRAVKYRAAAESKFGGVLHLSARQYERLAL